MKKNLGKKIAVLGAMTAVVVSTFAFSASASDDNKGFYQILYGNYANSYTGTEYRQTKSSNNPWKVNLAYNSEGDGTIATFWIAKEDYTRVSGTHQIKQGSGDHYFKDIKSAGNQTDVRLGVENNNDTLQSNYASGTWDEETW